MPFSALEGKQIAILGFGVEGKAALELLVDKLQNCNITVLQENTDIDPQYDAFFSDNAHVSIRTGKDAFSSLTEFDCIIKSPGISPYRQEIAAAIEAGIPFTSGTQLWCDAHRNERIIAITGTKGKSTTASLIAHLLNHTGHQTELLGNIGKPALACHDAPDDTQFFVMELSSYQTTKLHCAAEIAVLLNLFPEHTDWHGSTAQYFHDKTTFLLNPDIQSVVIDPAAENIPAAVQELKNLAAFNTPQGFHVRGAWVMEGERQVIDMASLPLKGQHNLKNLCAALTVIKLLGIDPETTLPTLETFRGLPHRLASLGHIDGVEYINDSISTTPESAMAALQSFPGRPCTQLLGGYDRNLDWSEFARQSRNTSLKVAITLPGNGERIAAALRQANPALKVFESNSLEEAVEKAGKATPKGGVVILSPGAPSYGYYRNYKERGDEFARLAGFAVTP
jgi:UDP-N-acetylmuramoylalanine--D-glutamate ligase